MGRDSTRGYNDITKEYIVIAWHGTQGKEAAGYRLLRTKDLSVIDIDKERLIEVLVGVNRITVHGLELSRFKASKPRQIKWVAGSGERYTKLIGNVAAKKYSPIVIIRKCADLDEFIVSDAYGKLAKANEATVINYADKYGIANGKVVELPNGTRYIAAIRGAFRGYSNKPDECKGYQVVMNGPEIDTVYIRMADTQRHTESIASLKVGTTEIKRRAFASDEYKERVEYLKSLGNAYELMYTENISAPRYDRYRIVKHAISPKGVLAFILVNSRLDTMAVSIGQLLLMQRAFKVSEQPIQIDEEPLKYRGNSDTRIALSGDVRGVKTDILIKTLESSVVVATDFVNDDLYLRCKDAISFENRKQMAQESLVDFQIDSFRRLRRYTNEGGKCVVPSFVTELLPGSLLTTCDIESTLQELTIPDSITTVHNIFKTKDKDYTLRISKYHFVNVPYSIKLMDDSRILIDTLVIHSVDKLMQLLSLIANGKIKYKKNIHPKNSKKIAYNTASTSANYYGSNVPVFPPITSPKRRQMTLHLDINIDEFREHEDKILNGINEVLKAVVANTNQNLTPRNKLLLAIITDWVPAIIKEPTLGGAAAKCENSEYITDWR